MPIYTYKCRRCGEYSEHLIFKSDEPPNCPKCGGRELEKQISRFGIYNNSVKDHPPGCEPKRS